MIKIFLSYEVAYTNAGLARGDMQVTVNGITRLNAALVQRCREIVKEQIDSPEVQNVVILNIIKLDD